jgi:hypothetical protein
MHIVVLKGLINLVLRITLAGHVPIACRLRPAYSM